MDASQVKTLDRLVEVLDCFRRERPAWTLAELAAELDAPKSTLHRFLTGLEVHGIVRREPGDKRWRLGYRLLAWGAIAAETTTLRDVAHPVLADLAGQSGETALITVYQDHETICIDKYETSHPVRLALEVGSRRPAHAGASSKVLMAYLPEDEQRAIVESAGLPLLYRNTITDYTALCTELATIRERGYAVSLEETDAGAWGVATPVRNWDGRVVAGVGLAGPTTRYSDENVRRWVSLCRFAAERISALMHSNPNLLEKERTHD